jgi:hypothetical protein
LIAHPAPVVTKMAIYQIALPNGRRVLEREYGMASRYMLINSMQILLDHSKKIILSSMYGMDPRKRESKTSLGNASVNPHLWTENNLEIHLAVVAHGVSWAAVGHLVRVGPALRCVAVARVADLAGAIIAVDAV